MMGDPPEPALHSRVAPLLIFGGCALAAALCSCGGIDLQATTLSEQAQQDATRPTFYVAGRELMDPCSKPVVLRGVNEMVTFIAKKSGAAAFGEIAKTNANSVRIYWRTSDSATELDSVLREAEAQRLIPIVYVFNGGSEPNRDVPTSLDDAVAYWTQGEVPGVIEQHKNWLVVALREKGEDSTTSVSGWSTRYSEAISQVRAVGLALPLAIDAPLAGSDVQTLLNEGRNLIAADPLQNLLLNINVGLSGDSPETLANQLVAARSLDLPIMVGELSGFSHTADYNCGDPYAFSTVLAAAQSTGTGWLAWSWGAATNQFCHSLDMADAGIYDNLRDWGLEVARLDPNSIERTSLKPGYSPAGSCN